jgi:DNA-binding PadR family transcriptional regulator
MSATRLLILGVLRFMQPAHGYSVRQELESWQADRWANVAFGSISFAPHKMAEEGLLDALDPEQTGRRSGRISYVVTPRGEEEFRRLLHEHWREFKPPVDPFMAAAAFMPELSREELLAALRHRLALARSTVAGYELMTGPRSMDGKPPTSPRSGASSPSAWRPRSAGSRRRSPRSRATNCRSRAHLRPRRSGCSRPVDSRHPTLSAGDPRVQV